MTLLLLALVIAPYFNKPDLHPACELAASRLDFMPQGMKEEHLEVCSFVAHRAEKRGFSVPLVVELSWSESRWMMHAENGKTGCYGPLQASPRWWCPGGQRQGCDAVKAGLDALEAYQRQHRDLERALCHFKSGNRCTPEALKGARRVLRKTHRLKSRLRLRKKARRSA